MSMAIDLIKSYKVSSAARIGATVEEVYRVLSDYKVAHPQVSPPENFVDYRVEQGGQGAGTIISFKVRVMGTSRPYRMVVSEPEPGLLYEQDQLSPVVTTFSFKPVGENQTRVEIATYLPVKGGFAGMMEKLTAPPVMRGMYRKELQRLANYLKGSITFE